MVKKVTPGLPPLEPIPPRGRKKTVCQLSLEEFDAAAKPLACTIDGQPFRLEVKEFSSGSYGWYGNVKLKVMVGDQEVACQVNITMPMIGSKPEKGEK